MPSDVTVDYFIKQQAIREPWRLHAACTGMPIEVFFPGPRESLALPKNTCYSCPVNVECNLATVDEEFGVAGGNTNLDRKANRVRQEKGLPTPTFEHGTVKGYKLHFRYGDVPPCPECYEAWFEHREKEEARVARQKPQ